MKNMNNSIIVRSITFLTVLFWMNGCRQDTTYKITLDDPETYRSAVKQITDIIVYDIFSPPVASRIYAYSNIAGFETLAQCNPERLVSLGGQLNGFRSPEPPTEEINARLASIHAFLKVGKALIFSEPLIDDFRDQFYSRLEEEGLPNDIRENSLAYGEAVADHVLKWAQGDMYKQSRSFPKYTIQKDTNYWKPTPPDYMEGIEPHWNKIRPLVLDSSNQFIPKKPEPFSLSPESGFYRQLLEVYQTRINLTEEQVEIAKFWDCNPYVSSHSGHAMFATKKITPGGHWIGIVSIVTKKNNSDFETTVEAFTQTSISLFDAFISCWDEKWRSLLVRPETLINQYLDENWKPLLQTPPFPEYTSGHSVISTAAAITLTDLCGDNFEFYDTTEVEFGLTARNFDSFLHASEEAAISRLYGGIHYKMAIENGIGQGEQVGKWVVSNLETSK